MKNRSFKENSDGTITIIERSDAQEVHIIMDKNLRILHIHRKEKENL